MIRESKGHTYGMGNGHKCVLILWNEPIMVFQGKDFNFLSLGKE